MKRARMISWKVRSALKKAIKRAGEKCAQAETAGTFDSSSKADAAIQKLRQDRRLTREELDRPVITTVSECRRAEFWKTATCAVVAGSAYCLVLLAVSLALTGCIAPQFHVHYHAPQTSGKETTAAEKIRSAFNLGEPDDKDTVEE